MPGLQKKCSHVWAYDKMKRQLECRYCYDVVTLEEAMNQTKWERPEGKMAKKEFQIKDSGKRLEFSSGSLRDTTEGKINWAKVAQGPMLRRWAEHLTKGAVKYPDPKPGVGNWTLIQTEEEYWRYKESAFRHFMQWFNDETDEDHASAVYFNINGVELIKEKRANSSETGSAAPASQG